MQGLRKENILWFLKCVARNVLLPRQKARAHQLTDEPTQASHAASARANSLSFISPRETTNAARPADTAQAHLSAVTSS